MIHHSVRKDRLYWPHWTLVSDRIVASIPTQGVVLGLAIGPFIVLRTDTVRFQGILVHEQQHVRQWWWYTLTSYPLLLGLGEVLDWRWLIEGALVVSQLAAGALSRLPWVVQWIEIDAHRRELRLFGYPPEMAWHLSRSIHARYDLNMTVPEVHAALIKGTPLESRGNARPD